MPAWQWLPIPYSNSNKRRTDTKHTHLHLRQLRGLAVMTGWRTTACIAAAGPQAQTLAAAAPPTIAVLLRTKVPAGLIAAQMANAYGAREIVAFDPLPARRAQATDIVTTLPPPDEDAFAPDRFADGALDLSIDCTGLKSAIQYLMDRTASGGSHFWRPARNDRIRYLAPPANGPWR